MSEIPYTMLTGRINTYFGRLQEVSVPERASYKWLRSVGFASSNDRLFIKILRYIKFIDTSNVPTNLWKTYKDPSKSRVVLAKAIREGYRDLYNVYKDAHRKDKEALFAFFMSKTGKAKQTVDYMVNTFSSLCQLADFEKSPIEIAEPAPKVDLSKLVEIKARPEKGLVSEIHINIQLHLPATENSSVYDNLFKSLRKHLLSSEKDRS